MTVYVASLAPGVTFWDAGEFIAAIHTLGVPHPPGTPLYILIGKAWTLVLAMLPTALALNLLSAVATALAGAITAHFVYRSTQQRPVAVAAAVIAGTMSTAWLSATETEVYALSLLLSMLMIDAGEQAGVRRHWKWIVISVYLIAIAVPLHLTALIAAPAAIVLASEPLPVAALSDVRRPVSTARDWLHQWFPEWRWSWTLALLAAVVIAVSASSMSLTLAVIGALMLAVALFRERTSVGWKLSSTLVASIVGLSALAFLVIRAQHDPGINQGDPSTIERWIAVMVRDQYAVAPPWPRQTPLWLQLANTLQYFDWQLALSLAPEPPLSIARGAFTVGGIVLAVIGARTHYRSDARRWRAVLVLLLAGSIGVTLAINPKAGPSIGWGILPDSAPHEPRERDYFFVLAFWAWAIWIAMGAAEVIRRVAGRIGKPGLRRLVERGALPLAAALPVLLNWKAVERRSEPSASLPRRSAQALLASAPERAVLFVAGDNDSYPLWYLQQVEGYRRDVTVVTIPIVAARWYQDELERRHRLRAPRRWVGLERTLTALANEARRQGRQVAAAVSVPLSERQALGELDVLHGWIWIEADTMARAVSMSLRAVDLDDAMHESGLSIADRRALRKLTEAVPEHVWRGLNSTERYMMRLLACPRFARESATRAASADSLDSTCNFR